MVKVQTLVQDIQAGNSRTESDKRLAELLNEGWQILHLSHHFDNEVINGLRKGAIRILTLQKRLS